MNKRGTISMSVLAISMVGCFWGINKLCDFLLQATHVSFALDSALTLVQQEKIKFSITHSGLIDPQSTAQLIKEKCPAVEHVTILRQPNHTWHIIISAAQPAILINDQWILSTHGTLAPRIHYQPEALLNIPSITMKTTNSAVPLPSESFKKWLTALDTRFFERYFIVWNHDYEITLTEKFDPSFSVITTCIAPLNPQTISLCDQIKEEINQRKSASDTKQKMVKADIRFDNQIVVTGDFGGVKHG